MALRELDQAARRVERYGNGGFTVGGIAYRGSLLLLPEGVAPWPVAAVEALSLADFAPLIAARAGYELVLIGAGARNALLPKGLRQALIAAGLRFDVMDSGAACRTFNVLAAEDRLVAAALIAVA